MQDSQELGKRIKLVLSGVPASSQQEVHTLTAELAALKKQHEVLQEQFEEQSDTLAGLDADNADKNLEICKLKGQLAKFNKNPKNAETKPEGSSQTKAGITP